MFSNSINISIETTALCMHSLALYDITKFDLPIKKGATCLYRLQDAWGLWFEKDEYFVSSEYLTVLVLDAIEISEEQLNLLTFDFGSIPTETNINKNQYITIMGDQYYLNNSQIGAVGPNSMAVSNELKQINSSAPEDFDFDQLSSELEKLKIVLKEKAEEPEEFSAISSLVSAEKASKERNYNEVLTNLKKGGKWILETAKEIGVNVVAEVINKQITG